MDGLPVYWNHRDIESNTIQNEVEKINKKNIKGYGYGTRRENQTEEIKRNKLFGDVIYIEGKCSLSKYKRANRARKSHATLERQAGDKFYIVINEIKEYFCLCRRIFIEIDYTTRLWMAKALTK